MPWHSYLIAPVVEGHGEVEAVPLLLKRWFSFRRFKNFRSLPQAVRAPGAKALVAPYDQTRELGIEHYVRLAAGSKPDAILVILDADDECLDRKKVTPYLSLGPDLLQRARGMVSHIPVGVVIANREFEAWFMAGFRRLRHLKQFPNTAALPPGLVFEVRRDCKGCVSDLQRRKYSERADQKALVQHITFKKYMCKNSPSFGKLLRELERLAREARQRRRTQASLAVQATRNPE